MSDTMEYAMKVIMGISVVATIAGSYVGCYNGFRSAEMRGMRGFFPGMLTSILGDKETKWNSLFFGTLYGFICGFFTPITVPSYIAFRMTNGE